jgi:hypothetical protein
MALRNRQDVRFDSVTDSVNLVGGVMRAGLPGTYERLIPGQERLQSCDAGRWSMQGSSFSPRGKRFPAIAFSQTLTAHDTGRNG